MLIATALLGIWAGGCQGVRTQSMLHPEGPSAEKIATLWWVMFGVYGGVFLVTLAVLAVALVSRWRERPILGSRFVLVAGVIIPTVILLAMLVYTIQLSRQMSGGPADLRIEVIGHQWWWEIRYPEYGVVDANEIHIPADTLVALELSSADVVHSLWVPQLAGKRDLIPGHPNTLKLKADRPGQYRGQCAEFCGTQHAMMAFWLVVHEPGEFERWVRQRQRAVGAPAPEPLERGRQVFLEVGCATCHRVEGVSEGLIGPDLTHVGSRLTLGAGVFRNTPGNLAGWLSDPQSMKPGSLMPPTYMPPEDLHALVDYLRSLK